MENKHTYKEYKFPDGEKIKCTVAFALLLKLRAHNKNIYEMLNNNLLYGVKDMADSALVLYGAYLCACLSGENGGIENAMTKEDFITKLDDDILDVMVFCNGLLNKKKN